MSCVLAIAPDDEGVSVLGTRHSAVARREQLEQQLQSCPSLQIDFSGVFVTQSFVDELLGPLILRMGPAALQRLEFSGCTEEVKAIVSLVIAGRLHDYSARQKRSAAGS